MAVYRHVYFRPWLGRHYSSGGLFDLRLLILGESHYVWESRQPPRNETERITEWIASGQEAKRFATNIEIAVLGQKPPPEGRREFWDSVAFYNFVQKPLPGPRSRPTPEMWTSAAPAFFDVLRLHRPDFVLVLGEGLWQWLPGEGREGPPIRYQGATRETWLYETDHKHEALAMRIRHPSWGFNALAWHPWVTRGLAAARNANEAAA